MRRFIASLLCLSGLAGATAGCGLWSSSEAAPAASSNPVDARQDELLRANINREGDPVLGAVYSEVNTRHFSGALPVMPVMWEPKLAEVGLLAGHAFTLEGMFGHIGKKAVILLDPALQNNPQALRRALCHEMAHAYLYVTGDNSTNHGPAFKTVLARLALEGAFQGIAASDEERASLRAWLDAESARLDTEGTAMTILGADTERERAEVERALADITARINAANAQGGGWPPQDEIASVNARREAYNQHAAEANTRAERARADLAAFNREVARYNLMLVYPDGMDGAPMVAVKKAG